MNIHRLSQGQAAALAGITARRLRQLDAEPNPPPKDRNGQYPCAEFSAWLADTRRKAPAAKADPGDQLVADIAGAFAKLCGCVVESDEPRETFLGMCLHFGLSKRDALIAYSLIGFPMAIVGAEASENPEWGIELPPESFYRSVMQAVGAGKVDEFAAEHWPDP